MIAWKRKIDSNEDLDTLVRRLEKRIFPYLPSSRREIGLKVRNIRSVVISLTFSDSDVISLVTMPKIARTLLLQGSEVSLRRKGFMHQL